LKKKEMQRFISGSYAIASDHGVFSAATIKVERTYEQKKE